MLQEILALAYIGTLVVPNCRNNMSLSDAFNNIFTLLPIASLFFCSVKLELLVISTLFRRI